MSGRARTGLRMAPGLGLNAGLAAGVRVLAEDSWGLTRLLEEQAAQNPALVLGARERGPRDWTPRWSAAFGSGGEGGALPEQAAPLPSLTAHVIAGVAALFPRGRARQVAEVIAAALEPSGWLGRPLADLAAEAGVTPAEAEAVLRRLQDIEPAGLFARNLAECLALQAREAGWLDAPMAAMLGRLDLLAAGATGQLARIAGVGEEGIVLRIRRIRSLNPKPGAQFDAASAPIREPDLLARPGPAGWSVSLNRAALPGITVQRLEGPGGAAQVAAARALLRQVAARGHTLLRVGQEVLARQQGALEHGLAALVPMTMAEVAAALDLHESTVSRAVAGTAVDTPRGTWWLRRLFSGAVAAAEGAAAGALRARLAALVAAEDKSRPLSDAALAAALAPGGDLARRTVAKYRLMLGIPPAARRRRPAPPRAGPFPLDAPAARHYPAGPVAR